MASPQLQPMRVAVSGAAERIAYSLVFRIASGGRFGRDQPVALRLLESVSYTHLTLPTILLV